MSITELDIERLYDILDKLKNKNKTEETENEIATLKKTIFILENNY